MRRKPFRLTCQGCKKKFDTPRKQQKYCDKDCYLRSSKKARNKILRKMWNGGGKLKDKYANVDRRMENEYGY